MSFFKTEVLYQSDDIYAPILGVSLSSLCRNNENLPFSITVIDCGIVDSNKDKLRQVANETGHSIRFVAAATVEAVTKAQSIFDGYKGFRPNYRSYLKALYPLLETPYERILYLDCDTIISAEIDELFRIDLNGLTAAMVLDSTIDESYKRVIGLMPDEPYFNSGVILIDVEKWRNYGVTEKILDQALSGIVYNTVDQDYINFAIRGSCMVLPCKFNFQPFHCRYSSKEYFSVYQKSGFYYSTEEINSSSGSPVIFHMFRYLGDRPWNPGNRHPFRERFEQELGRSLWKDSTFTRSSFNAMFFLEKVLYRLLPRRMFLRVFKRAHDRLLSR